jgi:hypothetical protein
VLELAPGHAGARSALNQIEKAWSPPTEVISKSGRMCLFFVMLAVAIVAVAYPIGANYFDGGSHDAESVCGTDNAAAPLGRICSQENANKVTLTEKDNASPIDIPTSYLSIAGAALGAGSVVPSVPFNLVGGNTRPEVGL